MYSSKTHQTIKDSEDKIVNDLQFGHNLNGQHFSRNLISNGEEKSYSHRHQVLIDSEVSQYKTNKLEGRSEDKLLHEIANAIHHLHQQQFSMIHIDKLQKQYVLMERQTFQSFQKCPKNTEVVDRLNNAKNLDALCQRYNNLEYYYKKDVSTLKGRCKTLQQTNKDVLRQLQDNDEKIETFRKIQVQRDSLLKKLEKLQKLIEKKEEESEKQLQLVKQLKIKKDYYQQLHNRDLDYIVRNSYNQKLFEQIGKNLSEVHTVIVVHPQIKKQLEFSITEDQRQI